MSSETRKRIVIALSGVELTAAEVVAATGLSLSDAKTQLKVLVERTVIERCGLHHETPRYRYASKSRMSGRPGVRSWVGVMP